MKKLIYTGLLLCITSLAYSQPDNPDNPVPLDGGLSLLVAGGLAYGAKKVHDKKKNRRSEE